MNFHHQPQPKSKKGLVILLITSNLLLGLALTGAIYTVMTMESRQDDKAVAAMAQADSFEKDLEAMRNEMRLLEDTTIPIETFKGFAQQYGVSAEFVQKFFSDVIVYKDATGIVYQPIDEMLPKNSYDFTKLVRENGRLYYRPEGGPAAQFGIDVSTHQKDIDWEKVGKDGVDFAMIRLGLRGWGKDTELKKGGVLKVDDKFEQNYQGATKAGIDVGVYFFSQAITVEEAKEEAQLVLDTMDGRALQYPIVFDQEEVTEGDARTDVLTPELATDIAEAFCEEISAAGYRPMIYANTKWFIAQMDFSRLTKYDKWLAQYYRQPFFPYEFQMWQYSSTGKVAGIEGNVDMNLSFTDYSE